MPILDGNCRQDILLIEDSVTDILMVREAFRLEGVRNVLRVEETGDEGLAYLDTCLHNHSQQLPGLIILDWNLPGTSGLEVLTKIKTDPRLKHIPVLVLTTSALADDVRASYESHANCFIKKPVDFNSFSDVMSLIRQFWFEVVILPPNVAA